MAGKSIGLISVPVLSVTLVLTILPVPVPSSMPTVISAWMFCVGARSRVVRSAAVVIVFRFSGLMDMCFSSSGCTGVIFGVSRWFLDYYCSMMRGGL